MVENDTDVSLVDQLAEEFAVRWRAGERPSADEYAAKHPEFADEIRDVFAGVLLLEKLKPARHDTEVLRAAARSARPIPQSLGEYRLIREIGRGGMGVVYEAMQESLDRRVAIKVLPEYLTSDATILARFRRESLAAARLHHTNIVPIYGVGECDGHCFYVMQLIEGRGLDELLSAAMSARADTPVPKQRVRSGLDPVLAGAYPREYCRAVARVIAQAADALAYAHSQ